METFNDFRDKMAESGFQVDQPISDGQIHRFDIDKPGDKAGWYILFGGDFPFGIAGSWKTDERIEWIPNNNKGPLSSDQDKKVDKILREEKVKFKKNQRIKHEKAAKEAQKIWDLATPAKPDHPYLAKKQIKHLGIKQWGKALIIPVYSPEGSICSIQRIFPDGKKLFLAGGRIAGGRFIIGNLADSSLIYIAEGFATCATIHEATGKAVVVAFNCGNLIEVAMSIRKLYPDKKIVIAGDNDLKTDGNPGKTKADQAGNAIGAEVVLPDICGDFNDLMVKNGIEAVRSKLEIKTLKSWDLAKDLFPKTGFPWGVFPLNISKSLKQLGRSCATSPLALPGAAFAIFSSILGAVIEVSPKRSWAEVCILWFCDIRPSGEGKTHAARALMKLLYAAQIKSDLEYEERFKEWKESDVKSRGPEPKRARGYFLTDLTLEGIREDLSGHGGTVCCLDELSSFLSSQNQYKAKGNDRESWLSLYDGTPARIVRVNRSKTILRSRVNIFGGIQPAIWARTFGGDDGLYLTDGTIYRFLATYEASSFFPLTDESWSEESQTAWEDLLRSAMVWSDEVISVKGWRPKTLRLNPEAAEYFISWRNDIHSYKDLPPLLRGFIPKITGAALRLSGVLHCMRAFNINETPGDELGVDDIRKGIEVSLFYMGHLVNAIQLLLDENHQPEIELTDQVLHLGNTLESLKSELDSGRLAIGFIWEKFNSNCKAEIKLKTSKAMGALLRSCGLTMPASKYRANDRTGVRCLAWDEKTELLIKNVHHVHKVHKSANSKALELMDFKNQCPQSPPIDRKSVDMMDVEKTKSIAWNPCESSVCGHDGHDGLDFSKDEKFTMEI